MNRKEPYCIFLFCLFLYCSSFSQSYFKYQYKNNDFRGLDIAIGPDSSIYQLVVWNDEPATNDIFPVVMKYNSHGDILWKMNTSSNPHRWSSNINTAHGAVYIGTGRDIVRMKENGSIDWMFHYFNGFSHTSFSGFAELTGSTIGMTGTILGSTFANPKGAVAVVIDSFGTIQYFRDIMHKTPGRSLTGAGVINDFSRGILVNGWLDYGASGKRDAYLINLDAQGQKKWSTSFDFFSASGSAREAILGGRKLTNGQYLLVGELTTTADSALFVAVVDSNGNWVQGKQIILMDGIDSLGFSATSVRPASGSGLWVSGKVIYPNLDQRDCILRLDSSGNPILIKHLGMLAGHFNGGGNMGISGNIWVREFPDGGYLAGGSCFIQGAFMDNEVFLHRSFPSGASGCGETPLQAIVNSINLISTTVTDTVISNSNPGGLFPASAGPETSTSLSLCFNAFECPGQAIVFPIQSCYQHGDTLVLLDSSSFGTQNSWSVGGTVQSTNSPSYTYIVDSTNSDTIMLIVQDQNCNDTAYFPIEPGKSSLNPALASPDTICQGDSTTLSGPGITNPVWNGGMLNNQAGSSILVSPTLTTTYTLTGLDQQGCSVNGHVKLNVVPKPIAVITWNPPFLISSAGTGNQWYLNSAPIPGATQTSYQPTQSGTYGLTVTVDPGCVSVLDTQTVNIVGQAEDVFNHVKIFPNPFSNQVTVDLGLLNPSGELKIIDAMGRIVQNEVLDQPRIRLNTGKLPMGVYFISMKIKGEILSRKMIKNW